MFSGIIEHLGTIKQVTLREKAMELALQTDFKNLELGESVAVNGVCLTVVNFTQEGQVAFHISGETLSRTGLGGLKEGQRVNLERAVSLNTRLSGHIVQGHVDDVGVLTSCEREGDSYHLRLFLPHSLRRYVVEKGSITVNGISLTVNNIYEKCLYEAKEGFEIGLMIIPHTWTNTDLSSLSLGAVLNIEVDVLAKYVENLMLFSSEGHSLSLENKVRLV